MFCFHIFPVPNVLFIVSFLLLRRAFPSVNTEGYCLSVVFFLCLANSRRLPHRQRFVRAGTIRKVMIAPTCGYPSVPRVKEWIWKEHSAKNLPKKPSREATSPRAREGREDFRGRSLLNLNSPAQHPKSDRPIMPPPLPLHDWLGGESHTLPSGSNWPET